MSKVAISGNASGTGTFTIAAPNSNTDRTLTLPDEAGTVLTSGTDITSQAQSGTVAFRAGSTTAQTISLNTETVIEYNSVVFDTNSGFNNSTYRFTAPVAGYYYLHAQIRINSDADYDICDFQIRKNGVQFAAFSAPNRRYNTIGVNTIMDFNGTTDYADATLYQEQTRGIRSGVTECYFFGFLVRPL